MKRLVRISLFALALLFVKSSASAQAVEVYAGHKRIGVDVMWFKNFKDKQGERSPFLFFSRNRASTDYENTATAFGSTHAVSYNFKNGMGIVAVGSFLYAGFTPKAGVQYVKTQGDFMFFGWLVADVKKKGSWDLFGLFRYQPKINEKWRIFSQAELFPIFSPSTEIWNITQRLRLGAKHLTWAGGLMADFNQTGKNNLTQTHNLGVFLRHEF